MCLDFKYPQRISGEEAPLASFLLPFWTQLGRQFFDI